MAEVMKIMVKDMRSQPKELIFVLLLSLLMKIFIIAPPNFDTLFLPKIRSVSQVDSMIWGERPNRLLKA